MAGTIISGAHLHGVTLSDKKTENPATITRGGYITSEGSTNNGTALFGTANAAWTITNLGVIAGRAGSSSDGIQLLAAGFVTNGKSGSAAGVIAGNLNGVEIDGKRGTVVNYGAILGLGRNGQGVLLTAGGSVVSDGLIEGTANGVAIGGAGSVVNAGTIDQTAILDRASRQEHRGGGRDRPHPGRSDRAVIDNSGDRPGFRNAVDPAGINAYFRRPDQGPGRTGAAVDQRAAGAEQYADTPQAAVVDHRRGAYDFAEVGHLAGDIVEDDT